MGIKIASNSLLTAEPAGSGKPKSSRSRPSARRESSPDSRADTPSVETSEDTLDSLFGGLGEATPGLGGGFGGFGGFGGVGGRGFTGFTGYGDVIPKAAGDDQVFGEVEYEEFLNPDDVSTEEETSTPPPDDRTDPVDETGDAVVTSYESSFYDTQITGSGFTSAYLDTLAILPMKNLFEYSSDDLSNTGVIFDLQNKMKDSSVLRAENIVSRYYTAFPSVSSSLQSLRDENLTKYNYLLSKLSAVLQARQSFLETTESTGPSSDVIDEVISTIEAGVDRHSQYYEIEYLDSDITKYDSGKSVEKSLAERLLGDSDDNPLGEQARTTRQYQILKAAIAQSQEGTRFDAASLENSSIGSSPYDNLFYQEVASISSYLASNIPPTYDYQNAKYSLEVASEVIGNRYVIPSSLANPSGKDEIKSFFDDYHMSFAGAMTKKGYTTSLSKTWQEWSRGDAVSFLIGNGLYPTGSTEIPYPYPVPTLSINIEDLEQSFINQISIVLSNEIMNATYTVPPDFTLPDSINPEYNSDLSTASTSTVDSAKYSLSISSGGKNIFLFDESLKNPEVYNGEDVGEILQNSQTVMGQDFLSIYKRSNALTTLLNYNGHIFSNNCALNILKIFYKYIRLFFQNTSLNPDVDSEHSAIRVCTFLLASQDNYSAGKLFRVCEDKESTLLGNILRGGSYSSDDYINIVKFWQLFDERDVDNVGPMCTSNDVGGDYVYTTTEAPSIETGGTENLTQQTFNFSINTSTNDGLEGGFWNNLNSNGGSLFEFPNLVAEEISSKYPSVSSNAKILSKIKMGFFTMLLYYVRKMKARFSLAVEQTSTNRITFVGSIIWYPANAAFISDCFSEAFTSTSAEDLTFSDFNSIVGSPPTSGQIAAMSDIFAQIRSPIKHALQVNRDLVTAFAYQKYVLQAQYQSLFNIYTARGSIATNVYSGDVDKATAFCSNYYSLESISEAIYRDSRYQALIPGTSITAMAKRSKNYRSIVKAAFNDLIPAASSEEFQNYKICVVGIPYGHLERVRLDQGARSSYLSLSVICDNISIDTDSPTRIDYPFSFITNLESYRPGVVGPYNSRILSIYDNFNEEEEFESTSNPGIKFQIVSTDGTSFGILSQDRASEDTQKIDFPAALVQAALQSYVEDVYGLYPRYASTKYPMRSDPFPEEEIADAALRFSGISDSTTEGSLIYSRLKSTIMMHRDFITTRMLEELEASPLFDRIFYILVDGNQFPDIISQVYVKLEA